MQVQNSRYIPEPELEQLLSSLPLQKKNQVIKRTFENAKKPKEKRKNDSGNL